jgi:curved DNA-binding protein CbpA
MNDPFAVLGLPARNDLTDEEVRSAWRRIAAMTHPDLEDGGDPARYSAAAAAYDTLRTSFGRGEALADLRLAGTRGAPRAPRRAGTARVPRVSRHAVLSAGIVTVAAVTVAVAGWTPAGIALLVGAATWLLALHTRRP